MAVLSGLTGLTVKVKVKGKGLKEHVNEDEEDLDDTVTRYIEATSNAKFTVHWTYASSLKYRDWDLCARLYLDGKYVDGGVTRSKAWEHFPVRREGLKRVRSYEEGQYYERDMVFSEVNIDESNESLHSNERAGKLRSLGEIKVRFWRGKASKNHVPAKDSKRLEAIEKIPEKTLKGRAISHHSKLGEAKAISQFQSWPFDYEDGKPFATFIFRYRSRDALKAEYIIPRTPSPVPLEERPVEDLTVEEARELVRRLKGQATLQQVPKREIKEEFEKEVKRGRRSSSPRFAGLQSDDSDIEIISVHDRSRKRQRTSDSAEVVDLSGD